MTAREYLTQIRSHEDHIKQLEAQLAEAEAKATRTGPAYNLEIVQTTPRRDTMERAILDMVTLKEEIATAYADLMERKLDAVDTINQLDSITFIEILYRRYIKYESLAAISSALDLSYQYTLNAHGKALQALGKVMQERGNDENNNFCSSERRDGENDHSGSTGAGRSSCRQENTCNRP